MNRKRVPSAPLGMGLKLNTKTGYYEVIENGITYKLTFSQMNAMKLFFSGRGYVAKISDWYNSLPHFEKVKVKRLGVPSSGDDFTPDPEYIE